MLPLDFVRLSICIILSACFAHLHAQTVRGSIHGVIVGEAGAPVGGAQVRLVQQSTSWSRATSTGGGGEFLLPLLPPGLYRVEIEKPGHRKHVQDVTLEVNQELRLEISLLKGAQTDSIEVTATRSLLKPENASVGTVIDTQQIRNLPLDGRNFLELSLLVPGAAPAAQGSAGSARGDFALHVNGSREDGNSFLLDGVYNGDPKLNTFGYVAAVDAIREFEVATSTYDASFGRNAGGQVSVVLNSGSNQIHGTAYQFFRNAAFDARNFFAPPSDNDPRYQRNQYGFSLGGPLSKNRTFLFGDYEGRRVREGITRVTNVPTALERTGDFSSSGIPFLIDPFTQRPFPGNRIPRERQHPIGAALAALYPLPNRNAPQQNFVSSPLLRDRNDQFDAKLDHKLSQSSDLTIRYSFSDRDFFEPFAGASFSSVPGFGNDVPRRAQNVMAAHTHAFTPSLLNEFRAAFTRVASAVTQQDRELNLNRQLGLPVVSQNPRDYGMSFITVPGFSSLGHEFNNPQRGVTNTYQLLNHSTWSPGRSTVKFGFEFRRLQQNAFRDVMSRGFINFLGFTGNALSELLQGLPAVSGVARLDNPQYLRTSSYNFFLNENWRLSQRLTITLGARYEYNAPAADRFDRANVYDPRSARLVPVGKDGFPRAGYDRDSNNIAPRFGFAFQPTANGATVIRGGYGVYYDQSALAPGEGLYFNPPYYNFQLFFASEFFPLLLHDPFPRNFPIPVPNSALAFQRDLRTPYMQHWNFNVQRQLGAGRVLEAGYVGSSGSKLISARDINQPGPSAAPFNPRPHRAFDDINILESRASSSYHSLQTRFQQRFAKGFSTLAAYTWSKSIDDASGFFSSAGDPNFPQDSRNVAAERARSNFDVRHRFTASYTWDLPLGKGLLRGGWQTSGVWSFQTGRPFTVALMSELDNSGTGRSVLGFGANDRPHVVRNPNLSNPTPERWFDTSAFAMPARGTFGSAGRNIVDGPGMRNINLAILKNFPVKEVLAVQFRAEAFNLANRVNLDLPDLFFGSPTFGRIGSAGSPRHIQFGLKFLF